jgi:hypothetical protein
MVGKARTEAKAEACVRMAASYPLVSDVRTATRVGCHFWNFVTCLAYACNSKRDRSWVNAE